MLFEDRREEFEETYFTPRPETLFSCMYLSEAFEVENEDIGQGPQTELDAALLQLFTVRTPPGIIRSQLRGRQR